MSEAFHVGDHVSYACNGVCRVEDIRADQVGSGEKTFYILKPVADPGSTIFVPVDSAPLLAKMQPLPSRAEIDALIRSARADAMAWEENRKIRAAQFQATIKACDLRELLRLTCCIYQHKQQLNALGKKLPASDDAALHRAEALIENELSFVLSLSREQVGPYIQEKLAEEA